MGLRCVFSPHPRVFAYGPLVGQADHGLPLGRPWVRGGTPRATHDDVVLGHGPFKFPPHVSHMGHRLVAHWSHVGYPRDPAPRDYRNKSQKRTSPVAKHPACHVMDVSFAALSYWCIRLLPLKLCCAKVYRVGRSRVLSIIPGNARVDTIDCCRIFIA